MTTKVRKIEKLTHYISRTTGPIALIFGYVVELIDLNNFGVDHICVTSILGNLTHIEIHQILVCDKSLV